MMSSTLMRAWMLSLLLAAAAACWSDATWSAHGPIESPASLSRGASASVGMVLHPPTTLGHDEKWIETSSEVLRGEVGVAAQLNCRADAELAAMNCPSGKTMLFSVRSRSNLSVLFTSHQQRCFPAGCVSTSPGSTKEEAVEEALLGLVQTTLMPESDGTVSSILASFSKVYRKDSQLWLTNLNHAMNAGDYGKIILLLGTAREKGYSGEAIQKASTLLQHFELEQELVTGLRFAQGDGTTSTLATAVDSSRTTDVDPTLFSDSLRVLRQIEALHSASDIRSCQDARVADARNATKALVTTEARYSSQVRNCTAARIAEAEDGARALAAVEAKRNAEAATAAAAAESQAAASRSNEGALVRMSISLKEAVQSLSKEIVELKQEKLDLVGKARDLSHYATKLEAQSTEEHARADELQRQLDDQRRDAFVAEALHVTATEEQREKFVARISAEKAETSRWRVLKEKETHRAEQLEQHVGELTARAESVLKQAEEERAIQMVAMQEANAVADQLAACNDRALQSQAEVMELKSVKTALTDKIAAAGQTVAGLTEELVEVSAVCEVHDDGEESTITEGPMVRLLLTTYATLPTPNRRALDEQLTLDLYANIGGNLTSVLTRLAAAAGYGLIKKSPDDMIPTELLICCSAATTAVTPVVLKLGLVAMGLVFALYELWKVCSAMLEGIQKDPRGFWRRLVAVLAARRAANLGVVMRALRAMPVAFWPLFFVMMMIRVGEGGGKGDGASEGG